MSVIRPRAIVVIGIIAASSAFNCGDGTDQGAGGAGGEGQSSSGSNSSTSSNSSSSSTGSPLSTCDTKSSNCASCVECSRNSADGLCVSKYDTCLGNAACYAYGMCVAMCMDGDAACKSLCESDNPTGVPIYDAYVTCVVCQDCYVQCDGAGSCM
ncbi:MAG TPA: hypothetical protein PK156_07820 [Polyangium sp.]|nr:hypothetical protein [Polyangium sp.]